MDKTKGDLVSAIETLGVHDHLCLIYETREQQFAAVVPFMRIGLERGEKCVYIADDNTASVVMDTMKAGGIDVDSAVNKGALTVITKREAYLRQGYFDPDLMVGFLKDAADKAKAEGSVLRVTGEMTWVLGGEPGTERLIEYEAKLNYFIPDNDVLVICQYNRNRFKPEIIRDVIKTHPLAIYGGLVCKNLYYVPPGEFLTPGQPFREVERLLGNIVERERYEEGHKRDQEELRKSENKYRTLLENLPQKIFYKDRNSVYISCNENYARDLKIRPDEIAGRTDYEFYSKELAEKYRTDDKRLMGSGKTEDIEEKYIQDGREVWVHTVKTPIRDNSGNITGILGIFWDITEQKKAEEELGKYKEHLEELVKERTFRLEAANKELDSFCYSVSHDLRAPLRAIDGFSGILLEEHTDKLNVEGKRLFDVIRNNAQKMGQLIDDLLAFSRMGRKEIMLSEINMTGLAMAVIDELKATNPGRTIRFVLKEIPPARGDRAMIHEVFMNILGNAVKFTRPREPAVIEVGWAMPSDIRRAQPDLPADQNVYYVKDNGVGFDMNYVNKIFGVFQRLHTSAEFEGTGVGLAIVLRIINNHGGRVWAEGKVNEGATFYFTLPKA